jgi:hypothetical protein
VFSHLPATLLFSGFLVPYVLLRFDRKQIPVRLFQLFFSVMLGVGAAAIYLLPALTMQSEISSSMWTSEFFQYQRWFFFSGSPSPDPKVSTVLLTILSVTTFSCLAAWWFARNSKVGPELQTLRITVVMVAGAWLLMTPLSTPIWQWIPLLQKVQFPWRSMIVVDFAAATAIAIAAGWVLRARFAARMGGLLVLALPILLCFVLDSSSYQLFWRLRHDPKSQALLQTWIETGEDADEYIPSGIATPRTELLKSLADKPRAAIQPFEGSVRVIEWAPRRIVLDVQATSATTLTLRQFYFANWSAWIQDSSAPIDLQRDESGLITSVVPQGNYQIEFRLMPNQVEYAGQLISGFTSLILIVLMIDVGAIRRKYVLLKRIG